MSNAYQDYYLEQYWPEHPNNLDMWADNLELLRAYYLAADHILASEGKTIAAIDISTGPCLAPLMAVMHCLDRVRLSDFTDTNRDRITNSPIGYWKEYAKELAAMFPDRGLDADRLLVQLDAFRKQEPPLDIDLRRQPIFVPDVVPLNSASLLTMHFVVDSICDTVEECLQLLHRTLGFIRPDGWLMLSALIDSDGWQLGEENEPSPNLSESQIEEVLAQSEFEIRLKTRSVRKAKQIYSGGWTVFLARRLG